MHRQEKALTENLPESTSSHGSGGLYSKVKMSVKAATLLEIALLAAFVFALVFLIRHNGFTVNFETDGGSPIASVTAYHSELLEVPEEPVKEGYVFNGWYRDSACTVPWSMETDTVIQSMTLYAGWIKKQ